MSHNVIDHFKDPVSVFANLRRLLRNSSSPMVHATPCYEYLYEYTRFHLYFFTGRSVDYLCEKSGFRVEDRQEDMTRDFISVRYRQHD